MGRVVRMAKLRGQQNAFGGPGIEPRWTQGNKDGVGTAYSAASRVWFTLWNGVLTEVYYPTADRPQLRDLQLLVTDGKSFFHEEKRHLRSNTERITPALGYRITNTDPEERYTIVKEVIADPHLSCVLQRISLTGAPGFLSQLKVYALCAPHLEIGGWGNNACVLEAAGRELLAAEKQGTWLALGATAPFSRLSCGYVGQSDGWTDLADNLRMDWQFDQACDGNVALIGELDLAEKPEFVLGLAFGEGMHHAVTTLLQSLATPFELQQARYLEQWERTHRHRLPLEPASGDSGSLYHSSCSLLLAHEDKSFPGALIASLSIPWGEAKGDEDTGGYHLVWVRDLVNSATGLLASGQDETPLRTLVYLAASQQEDGGFPQNFRLNGEAYWRGIQLDEVAFPILLARHLQRCGETLRGFDPYPMIRRAAGYLVRHGPATQEERWEEASGYSPSTLAVTVAALICAAVVLRQRGDETTAQFLEEYADFVEAHLERWTVTTAGTLVPGILHHFVRICPAAVGDPQPETGPNDALFRLPSQPPGSSGEFPAREIVDAGFLELVRYGLRRPDDPLIVNSLQVVDALLKVDTPAGPCWRRYNHDGFGQCADGGPFQGWGQGRAWPLLTGERGHYELAAGRDARPFLRTMEAFASSTGLLPEQVWDEADRPALHLRLGKPTGSAMPLMWAHAEYIKLLRSVRDGQVFDRIPEVADRYLGDRKRCRRLKIWAPNYPARTVGKGETLRVQAAQPFRLHWSPDDWETVRETPSTPTSIGMEFVDLPVPAGQQAPLRFTFFWTAEGRWEGKDSVVRVEG
jgi:glucoamylase